MHHIILFISCLVLAIQLQPTQAFFPEWDECPLETHDNLYNFTQACVTSGNVSTCHSSFSACKAAVADTNCAVVLGQCVRDYIDCVNNLAVSVGSGDDLCPGLLRLHTAIIAVAAGEPYAASPLETSCFRELCDSATAECNNNTAMWYGPTVCVEPSTTPPPATTEAPTVAPPPPTTTMAPPTTTEVTTEPATPQPTTDTMAPNSTETNATTIEPTTMEPNSTTVAPNSTETPMPTNTTDSPNVTTGETNMTTVAPDSSTMEPNSTTSAPNNTDTPEPTPLPTAAPPTPIPANVEYIFTVTLLDPNVNITDQIAAIAAELNTTVDNIVPIGDPAGGAMRLRFVGSNSNELSNRMLDLQDNNAALSRMGLAAISGSPQSPPAPPVDDTIDYTLVLIIAGSVGGALIIIVVVAIVVRNRKQAGMVTFENYVNTVDGVQMQSKSGNYAPEDQKPPVPHQEGPHRTASMAPGQDFSLTSPKAGSPSGPYDPTMQTAHDAAFGERYDSFSGKKLSPDRKRKSVVRITEPGPENENEGGDPASPYDPFGSLSPGRFPDTRRDNSGGEGPKGNDDDDFEL